MSNQLFNFRKPAAQNKIHFIMDNREAMELLAFFVDYNINEAAQTLKHLRGDKITRLKRKIIMGGVEKIVNLEICKPGENEESAKAFISEVADPLGFEGNLAKFQFYGILTGDSNMNLHERWSYFEQEIKERLGKV